MIKFWKVLDKWGEFSNFYRREIVIDGRAWKSSEHYFQAMKFTDPQWIDHIANQPRPREAADEGRRKDLPLRPDWEQVKDDMMRKAIHAKFTQHMDLMQILLRTGNEKIVEDSPTDSYWGWGADQQGKNMLGILLMELRDQLREDMTVSQAGLGLLRHKHPETNPTIESLLDHIEVLQAEVDYWRAKYE